MTSLTTQDGKLVVRDGKLGTEQACCCNATGACCVCEIYTLWDGPAGNSYFTEEEANARAAELNAELTTFAGLAADNGYECVGSQQAGVVFNPDNNVFEVNLPPKLQAGCCGQIDLGGDLVEGSVTDNSGGFFPCIPDETTRTCVDGLTEAECDERCGGVHHPGQTCLQGPCNPLP